MRRAVWIILALSLTSGLGAAAIVVPDPIAENVVEGHAVFSVIQKINVNTTTDEYAAAVAVLVREHRLAYSTLRFPGVLWFNDQYLVEPVYTVNFDETIRHPCSGAIIAVRTGDPAPPQDTDGVYMLDASAVYDESYRFVDPNGRRWVVDKWTVGGNPVWTVALWGPNGPPRPSEKDDGVCDKGSHAYIDGQGCLEDTVGAYKDYKEADLPVNQPVTCTGTNALASVGPYRQYVGNPGPVRNPGANNHGYPCDGCPGLEYNAVLYVRWKDVNVGALVKNHTENSVDWKADVSGCQVGTEYTCPAGNDDREGNSHPYNPMPLDPLPVVGRRTAGYQNHGGSADCTGDATNDAECHATSSLDIYYGVAFDPAARWYYVDDVEGSDAPFHCHYASCAPAEGILEATYEDNTGEEFPADDPTST